MSLHAEAMPSSARSPQSLTFTVTLSEVKVRLRIHAK